MGNHTSDNSWLRSARGLEAEIGKERCIFRKIPNSEYIRGRNSPDLTAAVPPKRTVEFRYDLIYRSSDLARQNADMRETQQTSKLRTFTHVVADRQGATKP